MNISALRTYALLQSALFQLLTEMPFEKITLTRLCARSMVPRSTFYRYFEDKYDLLRYCLRRFFEESRLDEDVIYLKNQESTQAFIAKVIAVAGGGKRELLSKRLSPELEQLMESRRIYRRQSGAPELPITENDGAFTVGVAAPVVSEGDLMGCILFAQPKNSPPATEVEYKLAETVAGFLGRQMEA